MSDDGGFRSFLGGGGGASDAGAWEGVDLEAYEIDDLERLVRALYVAEGCTIERTPPNSEAGVEYVAVRSKLIGSTRTVVAVKRADSSVSAGTVQQLDRARGLHGADRAALVRPGTFDERAAAAANASKVELVDGATLKGRLAAAGVTPDSSP
ncbi:restriction endonuclease [Halomarina halobia]|uniref:Restriction endonuclease n=1 Tax=Halomarina halobia TaxID=3033386 RepID=A0ABD6A9M9_9EURY|nr:restriction endonuclease [Halomarina sp. PSR21]